jgi:hypothetical protein
LHQEIAAFHTSVEAGHYAACEAGADFPGCQCGGVLPTPAPTPDTTCFVPQSFTGELLDPTPILSALRSDTSVAIDYYVDPNAGTLIFSKLLFC